MRAERGYTFVEILVVTTILLILASTVMPLAKVMSQRTREAELRRDLREMRIAIDKYNDAATGNGPPNANGTQDRISQTELKPENQGYPPTLQVLVDGVPAAGDATGRKLKFLRRVPIDPMTNTTDWGLRSYQDKPDSTSWGGQNVYDVYTRSDAKALDGTTYKDW